MHNYSLSIPASPRPCQAEIQPFPLRPPCPTWFRIERAPRSLPCLREQSESSPIVLVRPVSRPFLIPARRNFYWTPRDRPFTVRANLPSANGSLATKFHALSRIRTTIAPGSARFVRIQIACRIHRSHRMTKPTIRCRPSQLYLVIFLLAAALATLAAPSRADEPKPDPAGT